MTSQADTPIIRRAPSPEPSYPAPVRLRTWLFVGLLLATASIVWAGWISGPRLIPLGVFDAAGEIEPGTNTLILRKLGNDSPLKRAGLRVDDVLVGVDGQLFEVTTNRHEDGGQGPARAMGLAIERSQDSDRRGRVDLMVRRDDRIETVTVTLPDVGRFSDTFPYECRKSERVYEAICREIDRVLGTPNSLAGAKRDVTGSLCALTLLASGDAKYNTRIQEHATYCKQRFGPDSGIWDFEGLTKIKDHPARVASDKYKKSLQQQEDNGTPPEAIQVKIGPSNWSSTGAGTFLCEYFLSTGDESVLPAIRTICRQLALAGYRGRYGHSSKLSYGGKGLNAVTVRVYLLFVLAKECDVKVDETAWQEIRQQMAKSARRPGTGIGYYGAGKVTESAYRTGVFLTAQYIGGFATSPETTHMITGLTAGHKGMLTGHAFAAPGLIWGGASLARGNPEAFRQFMDFHKWYFSLSILPGDKIAYVGGWKNAIGDKQLNKSILAYPSLGLVLAIPKRNLRMHGARKRNHQADPP